MNARLWLVLLFCALPCAALAQVRVEGVRVWESPDSTRIVFDISGPVTHSVFTLEGPNRVVVDLSGAITADHFDAARARTGMVSNLRTGVRNETDLRMVLDLSGAAEPRSFVLRPNESYGHRLVIDLVGIGREAVAQTQTPAAPTLLRNLVIAIDAGHGGEDPGAVGPSGVFEKDIVMSIARRLAALVDAEYGMQSMLVRTGDYYVSHGDRIARARRAGADLFISIHADAFHDRRANGMSVYILSQRGATTEAARLLAERENAADMIGGVNMGEMDDMLASVLLDLSQTGAIGASRTVGNHMLNELGRIGRARTREVQGANFLVLKAPDVPSILVETGFISNPQEEARLRDAAHQAAVARGMLNGIRAYFADHAPPGTLVAANGIGDSPQDGAREHVIARGETLSGLARRYNVSVQAIRASNNLANDRIRVGQTLLIPPG